MKYEGLTDKAGGHEEGTFRALKTRFDAIAKELHEIHEEWEAIHVNPRNTLHRAQHDALVVREVEIFNELQQVLSLAIEIMRSTLR